jgi:hypothetical protein
MSRVDAAAGLDRLPWLPDDPNVKAPRRRGAGAIGWILAIVLLVGGVAFWLGSRSGELQAPPAASSHRATATVRLPAPRNAVPAQPEVPIHRVPEVEPIVAPPTPVIEAPPPVTRTPPRTIAAPRESVQGAPSVAEPVKHVEAAAAPPQPWPVRVIEGADGRLVRIGAFGSVHQAKRGWWAIVRVNPALKRLPALVVPVRSLRNGQVYYRLQMGTTSQAHSTVLCQRMRMIAEPCVVIGVAA